MGLRGFGVVHFFELIYLFIFYYIYIYIYIFFFLFFFGGGGGGVVFRVQGSWRLMGVFEVRVVVGCLEMTRIWSRGLVCGEA